MSFKNSLGIEITDKNIKFMYGIKRKNLFKIKKYKIIDIEYGIIKDGLIYNPDLIFSIISSYLKDNKISNCNTYINIYSTSIINRSIVLPKAKSYELAKIIEFHKQDYFPIDISQYQISYNIANKIKFDNKIKYNIIITAIPNKVINSYIEILKRINIVLVCIDISINCTYRVFKKQLFYKKCNNNSILVMDINYNNIIVSIISSNGLLFNKTLLYKISEIKALTNNDFILDINRLLDFYSLNFKDNISNIYIIGAGAYINNIDKYIMSQFNINTILYTQFNRLIENESMLNDKNILYFVSLIGLLNRDNKEKFNLLPNWYLKNVNINKNRLYYLLGLISLLTIIFIVLFVPNYFIIQKERLEKEIDLQINSLKYNESQKISNKLNETQNVLDIKLNLLENIDKKSIIGRDIIYKITNCIPENVNITEINIDNLSKHIIINGIVYKNASEKVLEYTSNISSLNNIININFDISYKGNQNNKPLEYTIEFDYNNI